MAARRGAASQDLLTIFPKCKCMCLLSPISFAPNTSKQGGGRATVHGRPRGGAGDGVVVNVNKGRERDEGKD
jgi:hypothetical protein